MSLFPAYAVSKDSEDPQESMSSYDKSWLNLPSFNSELTSAIKPHENTQLDNNASTSNNKQPDLPRIYKKKETEKIKEKTEFTSIWDDFQIDKVRTKQYLSVQTISRPSVPKYHRTFTIFQKYKKQKRYKRYFQFNLEKCDDSGHEKESILKSQELESSIPKVVDENFSGFKQEGDMSQMTAFYNRSLGENPNNIDMWLQYVRFQDAVYQFEKTYRKGSIAKGLRVTAERKLAILDKALTHLPNNETLLRERLNICVSVYPSDELHEQLNKLVEKDQGNIIFWQGLIESRQCSMSHCNTPSVINLYVKCLSTLHQLRRSAKLEKIILEENILRMLYQCGLFLKQSGLFELLWTLLRLYLELNISQDKNKFNVCSSFDEKQLMELEDVILESQLPLHELWLRIEKLRESCHWLPFSGNDGCEDPQRFVFSEDVTELIHPITMPGNTFKLTATVLTLLKVPLLPCRHSTMKNLGIDYVPWALDSIETVLPIFLNMYPIDVTNKLYINYSQKLTVGPQYLKPLPGQEYFLIFILNIIKNCVDSLSGYEKTAISVWWLRFQRILCVLENQDLVKMPSSLKKQMKNEIKSLLKKETNNIALYKEYALLERDLGNVNNCINILNTAISMYDSILVDSIQELDVKSGLCSAYRTLTELYLCSTSKFYDKQKALTYLVALSLGRSINSDSLNEDVLNEALLKFKHITLLLIQQKFEPVTTVQHFLPNFITDWIICSGWFLFLTKGVVECGAFMENTLIRINEKFEGNIWEKEVLCEFYVAMLLMNCLEHSGNGMFRVLDDVLKRSIEQYPNNIFILSVIAKEQAINCCLGQSFWKFKSILMKSGHALPNLFLIFIVKQKICDVEENWTDTVTGEKLEYVGLKNKMLSLFRALTSAEICTRRCGLIWRLYLQFLHENFDPSICRNAYYCAVEECPWLKALYIDAAVYIPAELPQIQDLLIEKQLRLHVTPEELNIMRN